MHEKESYYIIIRMSIRILFQFEDVNDDHIRIVSDEIEISFQGKMIVSKISKEAFQGLVSRCVEY